MKLIVAIFLVVAAVLTDAVTSGSTYQYGVAGYPYTSSYKPYIVSSNKPIAVYENYGYNGYGYGGYGYGGYGYGGYRPSAFKNYRPYYAAAYKPYNGYGSSYVYDPYYYGSYHHGIGYDNGYDYVDWSKH